MSRIRRVVFVDHTGHHGGAELGLLRLLENIHAEIPSMEVFFFQGGSVADQIKRLGVPTHVQFVGRSRPSIVRAGCWLWRHLGSRKNTILVANSLRSALVVALLPLRSQSLVCYVREDVSSASLGKLKALLVGWLLLPRFGTLLANSEATVERFPGPNTSRSRAKVVYPVSGFEVQTVDENRDTVELKRDRTPFRVVSLSRLQRWKGVDIVIDAVALAKGYSVPRIELVVAGGGELSDPVYERELKNLAKQREVDADFLGHVDDIDSLLRSAHVLCVCSRTPEAFGQVVPQAMARGVVVVAPLEGGPVEVIRATGGGLLVPSNDAVGFADAIQTLATDRTLWFDLAMAGTYGASRFSDDVTAGDMLKVLRDCIGEESVSD